MTAAATLFKLPRTDDDPADRDEASEFLELGGKVSQTPVGRRAGAELQNPVVEAKLTFARGGGDRTFLDRQFVPYPFHITRPHYLDASRPDFATLYLQSAAGGLYRGDRLALAITARPGAAAHVTSQAATVVHTAKGRGIGLDTRIDVHDGAVLALTTDPYVLFSDTSLSIATEVVLHPGARCLVSDGFAAHDPAAGRAPFRDLSIDMRVSRPDDHTLVEDRSRLTGAAFAGSESPLGAYRAFGSAMLLGADLALEMETLQSELDALGVLSGASPLPNGCGWGVRLLAPEGGALRRGLDKLFEAGFRALTGEHPARRRK